MGIIDTHKLHNDWYGYLNADINNSVTSVVLKSVNGTTSVNVPFYLVVNSEVLRVTVFQADTPSAGLHTLTVPVRGGFDGTVAASHSEDDDVQLYVISAHLTEAQNKIEIIEQFVLDTVGRTNGVQEIAAGTALSVVAQGTPDMTFDVNAGTATVNSQISGLLTAYTSGTQTAPVTNPRIDTIEIQAPDTINVVAGTEAASPSAPAVTSGALKLAEIYHRVGSVSIKDTDDSSNSYITDSRVLI